ncbi:hypothetical protein CVT24_002278 [Panaeolus cyanescens]|uniref:Uncharacterized protein n=1 Tax=Panaeolus cyanescens TaxID=181874 RepID=A0A409YIT0_9AGAR|nr:hypothetical protein CVT24_002278 [Panaeolus cyanescens]
MPNSDIVQSIASCASRELEAFLINATANTSLEQWANNYCNSGTTKKFDMGQSEREECKQKIKQLEQEVKALKVELRKFSSVKVAPSPQDKTPHVSIPPQKITLYVPSSGMGADFSYLRAQLRPSHPHPAPDKAFKSEPLSPSRQACTTGSKDTKDMHSNTLSVDNSASTGLRLKRRRSTEDNFACVSRRRFL